MGATRTSAERFGRNDDDPVSRGSAIRRRFDGRLSARARSFPAATIASSSGVLADHEPFRSHASSSRRGTSGTVNRKIVPPSGFGSIQIRPSWASMIVLEIDNPTPIPCPFVLTKG